MPQPKKKKATTRNPVPRRRTCAVCGRPEREEFMKFDKKARAWVCAGHVRSG